MTTTRQAKHLSINDLGKTIEYETDGQPTRGVLVDLNGSVNLLADERLCESPDVTTYAIGQTNISAVIITNGEYQSTIFEPETMITITGTDTPAGLNLHRSVIDQEEQ